MPRLLLTTVVLVTAACAGATRVAAQHPPPDLAAISARLIDCAPDATRIEDVSWRAGEATPAAWIATCGDRAFYCFTEGATSCAPVPDP